MDRLFRELPKGDRNRDRSWFERGWASYGDCDWATLLKSWRILIIAEGGAGKSFECADRCKKLRHAGTPAFALELAGLSSANDARTLLGSEDLARFESWLASESQPAVFFLDSYDELKLKLGSFKQALINLERTIAGNLHRCRIVVTSRPVAIERSLFEEHLPFVAKESEPVSASEFADAAMGVAGRRKISVPDDVPVWRDVELMPLSDEQVREMARELVDDPDVLVTTLQSRNLSDLARRPLDLVELCAEWKRNARIGTHAEQIRSSIEARVRGDPRRGDLALPLDRALEGAARLALGAMLARRMTIRNSSESESVGHSDAALTPSVVLSDWTGEERDALLSCPLFSHASYGRVRFHHRSVAEYLAAVRLNQLLVDGLPYRTVKRIVIGSTLDGVDVVKPSLRPLAAWLALQQPRIFAAVVNIEPELFIQYGDPGSLDEARRVQVLERLVYKHGVGGWRGLEFPRAQIRRFASEALSKPIKQLWRQCIENSEIRELLLNVVEAASLTSCADIALEAALDARGHRDDRTAAVSALAVIAPAEVSGAIDALIKTPGIGPGTVVPWAVARLFPSHVSVEALVELLRKVDPSSQSVDALGWRLAASIQAESSLSLIQLESARSGFTGLLETSAHFDSPSQRIRSDQTYLVPAVAAVCTSQAARRQRSGNVLRSIALCLHVAGHDGRENDHVRALRLAINDWPPADRRALFEADDDLLESYHRELRPQQRYIRLLLGGVIALSSERDRSWLEQIVRDSRHSEERRALALQALLRMSDSGRSPKAHLDALSSLFSMGEPLLQATLDAARSSLKPDPEVIKLRRRQASYRRRSEQKHAKNLKTWTDFGNQVRSSPDKLFAPDKSRFTVHNLCRAMAQGAYHGSSSWDRSFIERNLGSNTADRLRHALMQTWRMHRPSLHSERPLGQKNTYQLVWFDGLTGVAAEAEDPTWASVLTGPEAELASRYAHLQVDGLPPWTTALATNWPEAVDKILGGELSIELREQDASAPHSSAVQNVSHASKEVAKIFLPRMLAWMRSDLKVCIPEDHSKASIERLKQVAEVLIKNGADVQVERLRSTAESRLLAEPWSAIATIWQTILMRLEPGAALDLLEQRLLRGQLKRTAIRCVRLPQSLAVIGVNGRSTSQVRPLVQGNCCS